MTRQVLPKNESKGEYFKNENIALPAALDIPGLTFPPG
jgi:hypothetical protein